MSTPKYKKLARQKQLKNEAAVRRYQEQLKSNKKVKREFVEYQPKETYVRETQHYPSLKSTSSVQDATAKREAKRYTGSLVRGIATMHKSNAVPVISQQEAEDISKMRRN
jgi:benzoyl-CoA reductase/2-hydroxyglutaryl-CoA dehydratase subunit BcrC/BadD/HgdB